MSELTPTRLAAALSISVPYASQLLSGKRDLPREMAVRIFQATGHKLGPIADATNGQIKTLATFPERSPVVGQKAA